MGIWLGPMGKTMLEAKDIVYGGNYIFTVSPDGKHWELALLSGNAESLVFKKSPGNCDIFLVAGGQPGTPYSGTQVNNYYGPVHGSSGGKGGGYVTRENVKLFSNTNYSVTIGTSGNDTVLSGGNTTITAASGSGKNGGAGGVSQYNVYPVQNATAGTDGVYAYEKSSDTLITASFIGHKFGQGGGGGGTQLGVGTNASYGANGGESNGPNQEYGKGGGGDQYKQNGSSGYTNHGQGGGGAAYNYGGGGGYGTQGLGGSGIIFIRDAQ